MSSYCDFAPGQPFHGDYHDTEYGFPLTDDNLLFERLVHELNQAGLSWLTILKKRDNFRRAFDGFDIATVADYGDRDIGRLLNDAGIIRNRLKINAAIYNARQIIRLQQQCGSFYQWLLEQHPLSKEAWVKTFKKEFRFTGNEITNEFLMSIGFLPGAHEEDCPVYHEILELEPVWNR